MTVMAVLFTIFLSVIVITIIIYADILFFDLSQPNTNKHIFSK